MQNDSRIAILGCGVEGKAMTSYLLSHGFANITVCDRNEKLRTDELERDFLSQMSVVKSAAREAEAMPAGPKSAARLVSWRLGENYLAGMDEFDVIFRSPGISVLRPELAKIRTGGDDGDGAGGKLTSLTSLTRYFFEHCPCSIIGVTGTKGKGTTATLIYEILRASGRDVYLGGNIGEPPVLFLDRLQPSSLVVLELSSFQLMDMDRSPHVAVVLNITSEHMDYHGSFDEYVLAKQNIARYQSGSDFLILNRAHPYAGDYFSGEEFGAQQIYIDTKCHDCQDEGFIDENGMIVFRIRRVAGDAIREAAAWAVENRGIEFHGTDGKLEKICHVSEVGLLGEHNLENILPAIAVAHGVYHVPVSVIADVVKSFRGLPHRLEFAGEMEIECDDRGESESRGRREGRGEGECEGRGRDQFQGEGRGVVRGVVRFYNDSFSTTPETSIAGMMAFTHRVSSDSERCDGPILYLLAGGSEKNSVFDEWAATVMSLPNVRRVFLMGPSGERMGAKLAGMSRGSLRELLKNLPDNSGCSSKGVQVANLREAFEKALSSARNDIRHGAREAIVLLSPGAASFNEFENYKKRGETFRDLVLSIKPSSKAHSAMI